MWYIRPYEPADLAPLVSLINKADEVDQAGLGTTLEELRYRLAGGLDQRTFIAVEHDRLVGYIQLALDRSPGTQIYYGSGTTDPDCRRRGIGRALFGFAMAYLQRIAGRSPDRIRFHQFARLWIPGIAPLVQQLGFEHGKTLFSMRRPHMENLMRPGLPPGYQLRPVALADAAACAAVYNSAYAWREGGPLRTPEEMAEEMTAPQFRPALFPVAVNPAGRVMGYGYSALVQNAGGSAETGRIYTLVVSGTEQGKGIGSALLWECLAALKRAGARQATLSVEADNPTPAIGMYQRAGFEEWRRSVLYVKTIQ